MNLTYVQELYDPVLRCCRLLTLYLGKLEIPWAPNSLEVFDLQLWHEERLPSV